MSKRKRRKFTEEFKAEAIKRAQETGKSIAEVARVLGVSESSVRKWRKQAKIAAADGRPGALTPEEREAQRGRLGEFAAGWEEKYGEALDTETLLLAASGAMAAGHRLENAARLLYPAYVDLLERQAQARQDVLRKPVRGSGASFQDLVLAEQEASADSGGLRLSTLARAAIREIEMYEEHTSGLVDRFREYAGATEQNARVPVSREEDYALCKAAYLVSEWVRERHRDRSGEPDRRVRWADVAACLEFFGHDFRHIARDKATAVRLAARRFRGRHLTQP